MFAALVTAIAAMIASAGAIILTKQKEREALWRARKLAYYEEFIGAASGITGNAPQRDAQIRFANAINNLHLIASAGVINALHVFCNEIAVSNQHKSKKQHDRLWSNLVWEIRADLGEPPTKVIEDFRALLWASGVMPEYDNQQVQSMLES